MGYDISLLSIGFSVVWNREVLLPSLLLLWFWLHHNWLLSWRALTFRLLPFPVGMAVILVCGYCSALLVLAAASVLAFNVLPLFFCRLLKIEASLCASVLLHTQPGKRAWLGARADAEGTSPPYNLRLVCPDFNSNGRKPIYQTLITAECKGTQH